ncbi:protein kinase [Phaffia rhodozyma]|uniref:Protein kinase n=1 Tax=Phaffia rhodozyma TaxID=264483 RepID=A0A0F7SSS5_PHARH|nr:protein kinase [Phaffia rhodozyma]
MLVAPASPSPRSPQVAFVSSAFPSPVMGYTGTNRGSSRSRTMSRNRSLAVSVSLSKGVLSSQVPASTSPIIGESTPNKDTLTGSSGGDNDFLGAWSSFGLKNRSWTREVDTPDGSRGPSTAGDTGSSSRQSRRSRHAPVDPPFVEGDIITPYQPLPAASSSAPLLPVPSSSPLGSRPIDQPDGQHDLKRLEVVRRLGIGSYAVVYLVREVIDQNDSHNDQEWDFGELDEDEDGVGSRSDHRTYGKEFALKCLSKQDLDDESLEIQMFEATIHQSLPPHNNIVTLHHTFQTPEWLFLILELCPGEDLFYWLEHSKPPPVNPASSIPNVLPTPFLPNSPNKTAAFSPVTAKQFHTPAPHHGSAPHASHLPAYMSSSPLLPMTLSTNQYLGNGGIPTPSSSHIHSSMHNLGTPSVAYTPPTPSLLSTVPAPLLLAPSRVRLIASMFAQMCSAVQACHDVGVSHRDIKPENIIVTEEKAFRKSRGRVVCKLTDFGLATREAESEDVECGSRPYMAVECRNNMGPSYRPPPADVWSLGIVLINMLFHKNPWSDPSPTCAPFLSFRNDPKGFLAAKFPGMGTEVATYLAERVLAWDPADRVTAAEFGQWVVDLGSRLGSNKKNGHASFLNIGLGGKQVFKGGVLQFGKVDVPSKLKIEEITFQKSPVLPRRSLVAINPDQLDSPPLANRAMSTLTSSAPSPALGHASPGSTPSSPLAYSLNAFINPPPSGHLQSIRTETTPSPLSAPPGLPLPSQHLASSPAVSALPPFALSTPSSFQMVPQAPSDEALKNDSIPTSPSVADAAIGSAALSSPEAPLAPVSDVTVDQSTITSPHTTDFETDLGETNDEGDCWSRSASATSKQRKKRGVRKGKAALAAAAAAAAEGASPPEQPQQPAPLETISFELGAASRDVTSRALAIASQTLAREMSSMPYTKPGTGSSIGPSGGGGGGGPFLPPTISSNSSPAALFSSASTTRAPSTQKGDRDSSSSFTDGSWSRGRATERDVYATAGLPRMISPGSSIHSTRSVPSYSSTSTVAGLHQHSSSDSASWRSRGVSPARSTASAPNPFGPSRRDAASGGNAAGPRKVLTARPRAADSYSPAGDSFRTSRTTSSPASSIYSSGGSVSTYATSASSSGSYQQSSRGSSQYSAGNNGVQGVVKRPTNVKQMDGIPYQLDQLPRQHHFTRSGELSTSDDIFTKPRPPRPPKVKQAKVHRQQSFPAVPNLGLDTISERPKALSGVTMATSGTGGDDHRSIHSGRSVLLGPAIGSPASKDTGTGSSGSVSGGGPPSQRVLIARKRDDRSSSPAPSQLSLESLNRVPTSIGNVSSSTRSVLESAPVRLAPLKASQEKLKPKADDPPPAKLKGQVSTLRAMLSGLSKSSKKGGE